MAEKEYIERETLQNKIKEICKDYGIAYGKHYGGFAEKIANVTNMVSAADVQEVRHGKNVTTEHPVDEFICSECGIIFKDFSEYIPEEDIYREFIFKSCPNCGAKMDKE